MPTAGDRIAEEIKAALIEAAVATGRDAELRGTLIHVTLADPETYPVPPATETPYPCTCLFGEFNRAEAAAGLADGITVKVLVAAHGLPVVPGIQDRLVVNGIEYTIRGMDDLKPGGVNLLHTLYCLASGQAETV